MDTTEINGFTTTAKFGRYKLQCGRIADHPYGGTHMWETYDTGVQFGAGRIGIAYDETTAMAMWTGLVAAATSGELVDVDAGRPVGCGSTLARP
jgi:hypothetical protein